jgi:hypothetical protein
MNTTFLFGQMKLVVVVVVVVANKQVNQHQTNLAELRV